jgi:hypothetical protein
MPNFFPTLLACLATAISAHAWATEPSSAAIKDPGFEALGIPGANAAWRFVQHAGVRAYDFSADSDIRYSGKQSLRIRRLHPQVYGAALQVLTGAPAGKYRLQAQMRSRAVDGRGWGLHVRVVHADGTSNSYYALAVTGDRDWSLSYVDFDFGPGDRAIEVGVSLNGAGTGWVDDVAIVSR